ncbi:MAG: NAD-dependent epimerase/dehydratase family protein [Actinomycetota bacterium]
MAKTAFLLGGTGQIGRAAASRFVAAGWEVVLASRGERPIAEELKELRHVQLDREDTEALRKALGDGVDVLLDVVAFEPEHGKQLLALGDLVRSLIVISTGSVYVDSRGSRSLDEATNASEFPDFQGPIPETQPTVPPGDATYSTKKVAIELALLEQERKPVTIVRPWAIYGPGGALSREWYFVKRALDGRRFVPLGDRGRGRFHTTSTENLAELILLAAQRPRTGVFNCGDPEPPSVLDIARAIGNAMDHDWTDVLFEWTEPWERGVERIGDTPWSGPKPLVADMSIAEIELGYRPVTTYQEAVRATCEWLVSATSGKDWREVLTGSASYMGDSFDYEAEDAFVRGLTAG